MVTGTGFLGSYVVSDLLKEGYDEKPIFFGTARQSDAISDVINLRKVNLVKGDILDAEKLKEAIRTNDVKTIVHTAGVLISGARDNPALAVKTNVIGTLNVLEIARQLGLEKVVYSSSGQPYRMLNPYDTLPANGPVNEDAPTLPGNVYGTTKLACENLGLNYANIYGVGFIALRMPTVYGAWIGDMGRAGVIRDIAVAAVERKPIEVSEYESEWSYVRDMAHSCTLALKAKGVRKGVFNVGSGRIDSVTSFKEEIEKQAGGTSGITIKPVNNPKRFPTDFSKAKRELGYQPNYGVKEAVSEIVAWAKRHYT